MKTLLFIYNNPLDGNYGGSRGTKKAYNALSRKFNVEACFVGKKNNKFLTFVRNLFFFSGNLIFFDMIRVINIIKKNNINIIFFDVSIHGRLVKLVKLFFSNKFVIVNFHNNENKYSYDLYKTSGLLYLPIWLSARYNENLSIKYSDLNIFITENDRLSFKNNKAPSIIIPVTLPDNFKNVLFENKDNKIKYILFIGAAFYANIQGVKFLIKEIAPYISINIIIAGAGMEEAFPGGNMPSNIIIKDYIEDLSELFNNAVAFIAPLFSGSGMKVKLVEAMMYGKKIIGTAFSFCGFNTDNECCSICESANEFIKEIKSLDESKLFYIKSRELYERYYSSSMDYYYYSQIDKFLN